jgi:hypothetical protein
MKSFAIGRGAPTKSNVSLNNSNSVTNTYIYIISHKIVVNNKKRVNMPSIKSIEKLFLTFSIDKKKNDVEIATPIKILASNFHDS